jgi:integrase/recombinase XerD
MTSLHRQMIEDMQIRNFAVSIQESYVRQVSLFARHFKKSPERLGPEHIRAYQVHLTNEKKLSPGSIAIAIAALRFLYRITLKKDWSFPDIIPAPKVPKKLPIVLSPEEVVQFLHLVWSRKHRAILTTCYAAGLRISEAVALTPAAIDSKRMVLRVEQGKGSKDRLCAMAHKRLCAFGSSALRSFCRIPRMARNRRKERRCDTIRRTVTCFK